MYWSQIRMVVLWKKTFGSVIFHRRISDEFCTSHKKSIGILPSARRSSWGLLEEIDTHPQPSLLQSIIIIICREYNHRLLVVQSWLSDQISHHQKKVLVSVPYGILWWLLSIPSWTDHRRSDIAASVLFSSHDKCFVWSSICWMTSTRSSPTNRSSSVTKTKVTDTSFISRLEDWSTHLSTNDHGRSSCASTRTLSKRDTSNTSPAGGMTSHFPSCRWIDWASFSIWKTSHFSVWCVARRTVVVMESACTTWTIRPKSTVDVTMGGLASDAIESYQQICASQQHAHLIRSVLCWTKRENWRNVSVHWASRAMSVTSRTTRVLAMFVWTMELVYRWNNEVFDIFASVQVRSWDSKCKDKSPTLNVFIGTEISSSGQIPAANVILAKSGVIELDQRRELFVNTHLPTVLKVYGVLEFGLIQIFHNFSTEAYYLLAILDRRPLVAEHIRDRGQSLPKRQQHLQQDHSQRLFLHQTPEVVPSALHLESQVTMFLRRASNVFLQSRSDKSLLCFRSVEGPLWLLSTWRPVCSRRWNRKSMASTFVSVRLVRSAPCVSSRQATTTSTWTFWSAKTFDPESFIRWTTDRHFGGADQSGCYSRLQSRLESDQLLHLGRQKTSASGLRSVPAGCCCDQWTGHCGSVLEILVHDHHSDVCRRELRLHENCLSAPGISDPCDPIVVRLAGGVHFDRTNLHDHEKHSFYEDSRFTSTRNWPAGSSCWWSRWTSLATLHRPFFLTLVGEPILRGGRVRHPWCILRFESNFVEHLREIHQHLSSDRSPRPQSDLDLLFHLSPSETGVSQYRERSET